LAAAPVQTPARKPGAPSTEEAPFSAEILDWMSRGDSLAEPRVLEAVDLGIDEPRRTPPPGMRSRRAAVRERRLRRVLTVGALGFAVWAVVLWTTRQSVSVGDRSALAAGGENARAETTRPSARTPRPINPNAPGAAWATPPVPAPTPPPVPSPPTAAAKSPAAAPATHGQARLHSAANTASKHQRRGRR
jgi:hypothetical protein